MIREIVVLERWIIGKDGVVRGARVRRAGRGKLEVCQEGKERNVECESKGTEQQSQGARRPFRAAAKDGQCKSQLRLDLT